VIAGILKVEFDRVRKEFEALGLRLLSTRAKNEWQSGVLVR
jgi:hypothetical protein